MILAALISDIAAYLVAQHLATAINTDLFLASAPDSPDNLTVIYEYAGVPPDIPIPLVDRRVQIYIRNASYTAAQANAWAIFNALDTGINRGAGVALSATRTAVINALQTPFQLSRDAKNRTEFVFNLAVATTRD